MLDVTYISEIDKLFKFLKGLQPWVQLELRHLGAKDLHTTLAAAATLLDCAILVLRTRWRRHEARTRTNHSSPKPRVRWIRMNVSNRPMRTKGKGRRMREVVPWRRTLGLILAISFAMVLIGPRIVRSERSSQHWSIRKKILWEMKRCSVDLCCKC